MGNIFDTILKFSETYQNLEKFQRSDSSEFACGRMAFIRAPGWIVSRGWFSPRDGQHFRGSDRRDLSRFEFERLWSVIFYFLAKFFFKKSCFIDLLGTFLTSHFFRIFSDALWSSYPNKKLREIWDHPNEHILKVCVVLFYFFFTSMRLSLMMKLLKLSMFRHKHFKLLIY